jgi:hypothetical protein
MNFSHISKIRLCLAVFSMAALPLRGADLPVKRIADDSSLRLSLKDSWFIEAPGAVLAKRPALFDLAGGGRVQVRAEAENDEFAVIIAREYSGSLRRAAGAYPGWAQGSWVLSRRRDTGAPTRIRVFPRSDPFTYIQFWPDGPDRCRMDVVLYDGYVGRSLAVPVPIERLCTMPLNEALRLAGDKFPWKYFEPDPDIYREQRLFIARLREKLPALNFGDDGAIDEKGNYVYINSGSAQKGNIGLNCSGFAKWIIDGILRPVSGERLAIEPLKAPFGQRGSSFTDLWEERRDPFFGLDWIRNLASQAGSLLLSPAYGSLKEIEVRSEPFSQVIVRGQSRANTPPSKEIYSYPGFLENAGYGVEGLHALLYALAIDEPGRFYLAAVNTEGGPPTTPDNPRGSPRLRQYFHVAALIPYFNANGEFLIAVFESAAETSFAAFKSRYPGYQVNLVRVPVMTAFDP